MPGLLTVCNPAVSIETGSVPLSYTELRRLPLTVYNAGRSLCFLSLGKITFKYKRKMTNEIPNEKRNGIFNRTEQIVLSLCNLYEKREMLVVFFSAQYSS